MIHLTSAFVSPILVSVKTDVLANRSQSAFCQNFSLRSAPSNPTRKASLRMTVGIIYSTVTPGTERIAQMISEKMGDKKTALTAIDGVDPESLSKYEALIVGAPTLRADSEERRTGTPWDDFLLKEVEKADLKGKPVAVFGHGDAQGYPDNFCDAIEELHDKFQEQGSKMIGYTEVTEGDYKESKGIRDGKFLGLALDAHTPFDKYESRISDWCSQILKSFIEIHGAKSKKD